jgi:putative membrane protein
MFHGGWYGMGIGMGWMWIFWAVVLVAFVTVIVLALNVTRRSPGGRESPEDILRRRYAQGELDQEEYQKRLHDLRR